MELMTDAFGRVHERVHHALHGLSEEGLNYRPDPEANSVAWLIWHLSRVQDDHLAGAVGRPQVWIGDGWMERFGLPFGAEATGYGHGPDEVAAVTAPGELLAAYHDAVHQMTEGVIAALDEAELARVVDRSWDPPVTMAVRLVSVIEDCLEHVGQAAYVRGLFERL
ncbi:MAG: mycothiol transferase [Acidimicrobiales bacterium]